MRGKKNRIYGTDSFGRVTAVSKGSLNSLLKNRLAKHVEPEVREIVARRLGNFRHKFCVKDVALELWVRAFVIRTILNKLADEGVVERLKAKEEGMLNERFKVVD